MPKRKAAVEAMEADEQDKDMDMEPADDGKDDDDARAAAPKPARAAKSSKKRGRNADDDDKDEIEDSKQKKPQAKRKRLKSPKPAEKSVNIDGEDDDNKNTNDDAKISAKREEEMEEEDTDAKEEAKKANGETVAAKQGAQTKKTPAKKPRASAKKAVLNFDQSDNEENNELPVPPQGLVANATSVAATVAASTAPENSTKQNPGQAKIVVNGSANIVENSESETQQNEAEDSVTSTGYLTKTWVWLVLFAVAQVPLYLGFVHPGIVHISDFLLPRYKKISYSVFPPKIKVLNQTFVDELILKKEQKRQEKRDSLKKLKEKKDFLQMEFRELERKEKVIKNNAHVVKKKTEDQKGAAEMLRVKLHRIDRLLQGKTKGDVKEAMKSAGYIKQALGENDDSKLLDLSKLDIWEIAQMPACNEGEVDDLGEDSEDAVSADSSDYSEDSTIVDQDGLEEWLEELQEFVDVSTDEILKDDRLSSQVMAWVRAEIKKEVNWDKTLAKYTAEEVEKLVKNEKTSKERLAGGSVDSDAILKHIEERLELEIADQTGQYDFASIRNGAVVINEGPRATSRSLVQDLPLFNRLMVRMGLRFYGHGAEAALIPTDPPGALGQCWSFQSEERKLKKSKKSRSAQDFSRGAVATLAVRLARPVYVHSVVIEHPPREVTDRIQSAIRAFRIVGYEDDVATKGSYELGRFEYKIDNENPRMEFSVARKMSRQNVPKLKSIALAVESTWGEPGDYGCLYRFRVHGEDDE